ncbi:MAG TPA: trypsin-like peptidase domain-containing protein, partial [Longimicrobiales bacterium]
MSRTGRVLAVALLLPAPVLAQVTPQQQVRQRLGAGGQADTTIAVALSAAFRAAAERTLPAVVFISVEQSQIAAQSQIPEPFRDFFPSPMQPQPRQGTGSGVIIDDQGHILTNNHVVADASRLVVRLVDGREYTARVIGGDVSTDIAVIQIEPRSGESLPVATLGTSESLRVGDWVLALGNPLGLTFTVTAGIVSAKGRQITNGGLTLESFIQTDAVINPGNSGGPLIDLFGRVVGVNSAIFGSDRFVGYGFAVPIDLARRVMRDLLEYGYLRRPRLGVGIRAVTAVEAELYRLPEVRGALVSSVEPGLPAARAGVRIGDVILSLNGTRISDDIEFITRLADLRPGDEITLGVVRDGRPQDVRVTLGEFPRPDEPQRQPAGPEAEAPEQVLGFTVADLTPQLAERAGYRGEGGVWVRQVVPYGSAARAGLRQGTIILAINGRRVSTAAQVREIARTIRPGSPVAIVVHDDEQGEVL